MLRVLALSSDAVSVLGFFITKTNICTNFTNLFCHETLHVSDSSSIIRNLFTVHSAMVYVIQVCRNLSSRTWSCSKAVCTVYSVQCTV